MAENYKNTNSYPLVLKMKCVNCYTGNNKNSIWNVQSIQDGTYNT